MSIAGMYSRPVLTMVTKIPTRHRAARSLSQGGLFTSEHPRIASRFEESAQVVLYQGDALDLLRSLPSRMVRLVVTSPPYNIGKPYERKIRLDVYLEQQKRVIAQAVRILADNGSICWQVGNYVNENEIVPLDIALYPIFKGLGLKLRNRIIWHFEHGLHCSRRLSGRHETILWFTKSDEYVLNLDAIRVPQKYPFKKAFKGPRVGQFTSNPLGKNPGDVWIIPNVKHNHVEKTEHPCQFPVELVDRLVLALTDPNDWVVDPFIGVGTTAVSAVRHGRRVAGADIVPRYIEIARQRITLASQGMLRIRPMERPIYEPPGNNNSSSGGGGRGVPSGISIL